MNIRFDQSGSKLSFEKLSKIKIISLDDYGKGLQYNLDLPSGAHEIRVIHGSRDCFISIDDFFLHISSIPYARCAHFNLPSDFDDRNYVFELLNKEEIDKYLSAYIDGFFDHLYPISGTSNLWKLKLNIENFLEGYKLITLGTEQVLLCKTDDYYIYFVSQSID